MNLLKLYIKYATILIIILQVPNAFAYESLTTGESFSTSKDDACKRALDQAREAAAQQARVYVSSKYERRIEQLSGEVVENVTHQTYQSTFGITDLIEIVKKQSNYDEETGSITCQIEARFEVDTESVSKELEARITLEEAKIKEANRKAQLLTMLNNNEQSYAELKEKAKKYDTAAYAGSVICKESYSVKDCKNELIEKFEREKADQVADDLNVSSQYVTIIFDEFDGDEEHKTMKGYDDTFVITMTGTYSYRVDVSDPFIDENRRIVNELAIVNGYNKNVTNNRYDSSTSLDEDLGYYGNHYSDDSESIFSSIVFDIGVTGGDLFGFDEYIDEGKTEAYISSLIQIGLIFNAGDESDKNLFRVAFYSATINMHTCLFVDLSDKCITFSSVDTNVKGLGLEKIVEGASIYINFGGVFFKVEDKDIIGTDFIQLKIGVSNKGPGLYMYADMYSLIPTSKSDYRDFEPSIDIALGIGVRF